MAPMKQGPLSCLHSPLFVFALFPSMCRQDISALLVYDSQIFPHIRGQTLVSFVVVDGTLNPPPLLSDLLAYSCRLPDAIPHKRCFRRQGKHSRGQVKFKAYAASTCVTCPLDGCYLPSAR